MSSYSRDSVVSAVKEYYCFLKTLYLPTGSVKYPPGEGWPEITSDRLSSCNLNETVVDLLRHLPYIEEKEHEDIDTDCPEIAEECVANNYVGLFDPELLSLPADDPIDDCLVEKLNGPPHPHIATLGRARVADNGHWLFCDTEDGELIMYDFTTGVYLCNDNPKEFFAELKDRFLSLKYTPTGPYKVSAAHPRNSRAAAVQKVYRDFGWPTNEYRKEECLAEIQMLQEREAQ